MKKYAYVVATLLVALVASPTVTAQETNIPTFNEFTSIATCDNTTSFMIYEGSTITFLGEPVTCGQFTAQESSLTCLVGDGASEGVIYADSSFSSGFSGALQVNDQDIVCASVAQASSSDPVVEEEEESVVLPTETSDDPAVQSEAGKLPEAGPSTYLVLTIVATAATVLFMSGAPKKLYRKIMFNA